MMLWKCCTQYASKFGILIHGYWTGNGQFSLHSQRKAMPKNVQTTAQLHSSHTLARLCSKFSKPNFNSTWTVNFQMFKLDLEKAEEPEIKLPMSFGSWKKPESSRKTCTSALLTTPKPLTVWITTNKGRGGDVIPVDLFQILRDDAVKVLPSICQQNWTTQRCPRDWKRSVFIPILKKGIAKECSNYCTIILISHSSKVMLKILQARLQQCELWTMNHELSDVQAGFRKGRGTRDQIANICWIIEKAREFQESIYFCFIDYAKTLDCVDHNKLKNYERDGNTRSPYLPPEKSVCRSRSYS